MKDNIFLKSAISVAKILVLFLLAYLFVGIFFAKNTSQLLIGFFILIFITLPTVFIFFFKDNFFKKYSKYIVFWEIYRTLYMIFIVILISAYIFGVWHLSETAKTQKTIDFINSKKITLDDVMGKNLPPQPNQKINDSTIAGIDANNNYIRDDVELAIFKEYPNSPKIREAELQYAQALQLELTQVNRSETLIPVMKKENKAIDCIGETGPQKVDADGLKNINNKKKEVENFVLNTDLRKNTELNIINKYMAGYASLPGDECDIKLSSLQN